jgi:hypothetical protein
MILGLGGYFIVYPAYEGIGEVESKIEEKEKQIDSARELRNRNLLLDGIYRVSRARATDVHEGFFGEMTTTVAVSIVQEILSGANNGEGFTDVDGIGVSDISEASLSLQMSRVRGAIRYGVRDFAFVFVSQEQLDATARAEAEEAAKLFDEENEFVWNPLLHAAAFAVARETEGMNAQELAAAGMTPEERLVAKMNELGNTPVLLLREITEMLKDRSAVNIHPEHRKRYLEMLRTGIAVSSTGVGNVIATFSLEMTYEEYLDFLDYLYEYPMRLAVNTCVLFQSVEAEAVFRETTNVAGDTEIYAFSLSLYVVRPMEMLPSRFMPDEGAQTETREETQDEEQE